MNMACIKVKLEPPSISLFTPSEAVWDLLEASCRRFSPSHPTCIPTAQVRRRLGPAAAGLPRPQAQSFRLRGPRAEAGDRIPRVPQRMTSLPRLQGQDPGINLCSQARKTGLLTPLIPFGFVLAEAAH